MPRRGAAAAEGAEAADAAAGREGHAAAYKQSSGRTLAAAAMPPVATALEPAVPTAQHGPRQGTACKR
eukprot:364833-Chlamydomonas_euryale.AAC.21